MIFLNTALAASPRYRQTEEPPASTYDIDFQAKIDFANANSIPVPPESILEYYNQRVIDFKATDVWSKADAVLDYSGVDDTHIGFRLIDIKRRIKVDAYGGLIWTSEGVEGNGTSGYIDLKFNPSVDGVNYTLTNAGIVAKIYKNVAGTNTKPKCLVAYYSSVNDYTMFVPRQTGGGNGTFYISHGGIWSETINTIGHIGLNGLYRTGNTLTVIGSATMSETHAPVSLPGGLYMLARNRADLGTVDNFSDERVGFLVLGADMSAEHSAIENAI